MKTFEARRNAIGGFLNQILKRFNTPTHYDRQTAIDEIADMVDALVATWPDTTQAEFPEQCARFKSNLLRHHRGRSWPDISTMVKSAEAIRGFAPAKVHLSDEEKAERLRNLRLERLKLWLSGEISRIPPGFITEESLDAIGATPEQRARSLHLEEVALAGTGL